jgi:hypothetical protein
MTAYEGYADGDRVRDVRDGSTGTVRITTLDPDDAAECGYDTTAEVRWDNSFVACALDLALPHLAPLPGPPSEVDDEYLSYTGEGPAARGWHRQRLQRWWATDGESDQAEHKGSQW